MHLSQERQAATPIDRAVSRRLCLGALGGLPAALLAPGARAQSAAALPSLRDAAAARGIRYGAHPYDFPPVFTPEYDRLVLAQCGMLAPVLNWSLTSPTPREFRTGTDGGIVALARAHGLPLTGAHLLWFEALPDWFRSISEPNAARALITDHIDMMGRTYADAMWSVNVINEALEPSDGRTDGLRRDPFSRLFGASYWDFAFHAAREAFPRSLLVYNDYGMEQGGREMTARRAALLRRLDAMRTARVPVDAVGLQAHLTLAKPFDAAGYASFLGEIAARGFRIIISELDVLDVRAPATIAPRDQAVAEMYRRYLGAALSERAVIGVVTWGLSDRYTWLTPRYNRNFGRPDGLPTRPLPFDAEFRPKPAFTAILEAFRAAPHRGE